MQCSTSEWLDVTRMNIQMWQCRRRLATLPQFGRVLPPPTHSSLCVVTYLREFGTFCLPIGLYHAYKPERHNDWGVGDVKFITVRSARTIANVDGIWSHPARHTFWLSTLTLTGTHVGLCPVVSMSIAWILPDSSSTA